MRHIQFSAYARELTDDVAILRRELAPFTGAFVSKLPLTTALLRLLLTTLSWENDSATQASRLFVRGIDRLLAAASFAAGDFVAELEEDRTGWRDFYDALDSLEVAIGAEERWALAARDNGAAVIARSAVAGA